MIACKDFLIPNGAIRTSDALCFTTEIIQLKMYNFKVHSFSFPARKGEPNPEHLISLLGTFNVFSAVVWKWVVMG